MRKNLLVFAAVTLVSIVAAALGHAYCRPFCMMFKPMAWPFVCLAVLVIRHLHANRKQKDNK